ncbi:MAG: serine hydrolase [Asgard group archaeon]|nr:serine hydrolase [Asgard group archaeon]
MVSNLIVVGKYILRIRMLFTNKNKLIGICLYSFLTIIVFTSNQLSFVNAVWPTEGWATSSPINQQMNGAQLDSIDDYFLNWNDDHQLSHIDQFVVIRNGYLIKEWYTIYYDETDIHQIWSVTKSFICTLMGIAIEEGYISSVNEYVLDFFSDRTIANVDSRKEAMTIEHLLLMSTGFAYPGDDAIWGSWMSASDQVQYILDLPMATDPGAIYNYDTGGSHLISAIIQEATGMNTSDFADQYLFNKLGISNYYWQEDKQGIAFGGHGLMMTPRDMAKLGYLYINDGYWDGEQILPDNWVNEVTQTQWTFNVDWGYAKQWWTNPSYSSYSAQGRYGQSVFVFPDEEIIVAITGTVSDHDSFFVLDVLVEYVLGAITTTSERLSLGIFIPIAASFFVVFIVTIINSRKKI